jgi:hypothetical protein
VRPELRPLARVEGALEEGAQDGRLDAIPVEPSANEVSGCAAETRRSQLVKGETAVQCAEESTIRRAAFQQGYQLGYFKEQLIVCDDQNVSEPLPVKLKCLPLGRIRNLI